MNSIQDLFRELHRRSVWQVVGIYLATSWGVLNAVDVLTGFAGLPDWTPTMAVVLLLIGFPIVTATAVIQRGLPGATGSSGRAEDGDSAAGPGDDRGAGHAEGSATTLRPGSHLSRLFTWRNALMGGAAAGLLLLVSGGTYLAMWTLGIGPVGSLVAQGVLDSRDPVLLVSFDDRGEGDDLGAVVADALAVDLGASPVVTLLADDEVANALRLMGRDPTEPVTSELAREVALRTNIKAYIEGEITRVGSRYLLVARIVGSQSGEDLVSFREDAENEDDLLPAIDRLSQRLREKLGESLRDIRLGAPLEEVTTGSFEALTKLTQAERAEEEGDYALAERLVHEAIALDPGFAMAYRKLSVILFNAGRPEELIVEASTLAYENRDRLTDRERYLTEANYHSNVTRDDLAAIEAYDALLEIEPDDPAALNNSANILRRLTRYEEAKARLDRAVRGTGGASSVAYFNQIRTGLFLADTAGVLEAVAVYRERYPGHIYQPWADLLETMAVGELDGIEGRLRVIDAAPDLEAVHAHTARIAAATEIGRGRLARSLERARAFDPVRFGFSYAGFFPLSTGVADLRFWVLDDSAGAVEALQSSLAGGFEGDGESAPWGESTSLYALAGRPDLAVAMMARWEREVPDSTPLVSAHRAAARAVIDLVDGRVAEALDATEVAARNLGCPRCFEWQRALMLERLERYDEAIEIWETIRDYPVDLEAGGFERIVALKRLGPLEEQAGDTAAAIEAYRSFVNAWVDADPELQPQVRRARARVGALGG